MSASNADGINKKNRQVRTKQKRRGAGEKGHKKTQRFAAMRFHKLLTQI